MLVPLFQRIVVTTFLFLPWTTTARNRREQRLRCRLQQSNALRSTLAERRLNQIIISLRLELSTIAEQLTAARAEQDHLRRQVRELQTTNHIQETEIAQLWSVIARDRERVKAESAIAARTVAVDPPLESRL